MRTFILTCAVALTLAGPAFSADAGAQPTAPAATASGAVAKTAADDDWRTMVRKVKQLKDDTGIKGFLSKDPPKYLTEGYLTPSGAYIPGQQVKVIFGLPYGLGQAIMILVCLVLLYLAIVKEFEPLLLLPIGFGGLLANMPYANVTAPPVVDAATKLVLEPGGFLYYFFEFGVNTGLFPIIIFMGVGAMTDFGPLIANPRTALLGAAAQFGIFVALLGALVLSGLFPNAINFGLKEAASIGIIGGADGPTAIWLTTKLAPHLLGAIAVAAYSYMALVPIIQPPIMKALIPEHERKIVMRQLRPVSKMEKVCFPLIVLLLCALLLPSAVPLIGALMLGNLAREVGPNVARIADTMSNALINIVTIMLGLAVGSKLACEKFLNPETLGILVLGLIAFSFGTAGGCWMGRLMNKFCKDPINPLIGSAGVSAVPMAARVSNKVGLESDPNNYLLMHAMGPNVSGVIGSAVVAGVLYTLCK
ncbi:MAG TPA: sodium ion-translocating decarboxylase subunit beta [Kiritimatiellia bacterium]|nr:sodium ion-translocating decarboxylase subunit beta [Kiritimatiellia bacterium]